MLRQPWVSALGQGLWYKQAKKLADMNSIKYYTRPRTDYKQTRTCYNSPNTYYKNKNNNICFIIASWSLTMFLDFV